MITGWQNTESFKRHMDEMANFRRAHAHLPAAECGGGGRTAAAPRGKTRAQGYFFTITDAKGKLIMVPLWDITLPKGAQN